MHINELLLEAPSTWNKVKELAEEAGLTFQLNDYMSKKTKKVYMISLSKEDSMFFQDLPRSLFDDGVYVLYHASNIPQAIKAIDILKRLKEHIDLLRNNPAKIKEHMRYVFKTWLDKTYEYMDDKSKNLRKHLQLYVPRSKTHGDIDSGSRIRSRNWVYDYDEEGNEKNKTNESLHGALLHGKSNLNKGGNKPWGNGAFWTSSAYKNNNGEITSDWLNLVIERFPDWYSHYGYIYKIKPGARILVIDDERDAVNVIRHYNMLTMTPEEIKKNEYIMERDMIKDFPWDQLPLHWDGLHVPYPRHAFGYDREIYWFHQDWDVESTVWFDPASTLERQGQVVLARYNSDGDDDENF